MTQAARSYGPTARLFHWAIAAAIAFQIPFGYYMTRLPLSPDKFESYALHKSVGISILAVSALRLAWRWIKRPPPLPPSTPVWQAVAAKVTHAGLYLATFALPITGWLHSSAANVPVILFGIAPLPALVAPDKGLADRLHGAHELLGYALTGLLAAHIGAALYHHFAKRDQVLSSMLPMGARP